MKPSPESPCSTFALDVYWASGRTGAAHLELHLEQCAACRAYLAMLDEVDAAGEGEITTAIRPRARGPQRLRLVAQGTVALAFAAGVGLFVENALRPPTTPVYVGVKGTPSVQLFVHHGGETAIWDGRSRVHAGDAIALRAACGDLANVSVAAEDRAPEAHRAWARLSDGPCLPSNEILPFTLVVDGQSEDEHVAVVMSEARLSDAELNRAANDTERSSTVWVVRFVIPEERP
jgi:hypothetical protein